MKSKTYDEFVDYYKHKLTTDDCYTPKPIYEAIRDWACQQYDVDPESIVRPFWPGADYQAANYPAGCVVLDNPPFSILSKICEWYLDNGIKFFLFAPTLTALSGKNICMRMNHIICSTDIVYENGAKIKTSFVTNLGDGNTICQTAPDLDDAINQAVAARSRVTASSLPLYTYPANIITASMMQKYSSYHISIAIRRDECVPITALDSQKAEHKTVFGSGLLVSAQAAARHQQVQQLAKREPKVWSLSDREKKIIEALSAKNIRLQQAEV